MDDNLFRCVHRTHKLAMLKKTLLAVMCGMPLLSQAAGPDVHSSSVGAHSHGTATLQAIMEGDILHLEVQTPAVNIVGFEHPARTAEQIAALERAQAALATTDSAFRLVDGECRLLESSWDFSAVQADGEKSSSDKDGASTPSHDSAHHESEQEHGEHGDVVGHYGYQCEDPGSLESIIVTLLDTFSGIQSLAVEWIVEGKQGTVTLDADHNRIHLR